MIIKILASDSLEPRGGNLLPHGWGRALHCFYCWDDHWSTALKLHLLLTNHFIIKFDSLALRFWDSFLDDNHGDYMSSHRMCSTHPAGVWKQISLIWVFCNFNIFACSLLLHWADQRERGKAGNKRNKCKIKLYNVIHSVDTLWTDLHISRSLAISFCGFINS